MEKKYIRISSKFAYVNFGHSVNISWIKRNMHAKDAVVLENAIDFELSCSSRNVHAIIHFG